MENKQFTLNKSVKDMISGIVSGSLSCVLLHPLDSLKTRLQADGRGEKFQFSLAKGRTAQIIKNEGLSSLYKGLIPGLIGVGGSWGLYFLFYNNLKRRISQDRTDKELSSIELMTSAAIAGGITCLFTNPFFLIKTRLQLQSTFSHGETKYSGTIDGIKKIVKNEGITGIYKGLGPSLVLTSHGSIQFLVYEKLKYYIQKKNIELNSWNVLLFGSISKIIASVTTYPLQVVKTRLQDQRNMTDHVRYNGMGHALSHIYKTEGFASFYRGVVPHIMRVTPNSALILLFSEKIMKFLDKY